MSAAKKVSTATWSALMDPRWVDKVNVVDFQAGTSKKNKSNTIAISGGMSPEQALKFILKKGVTQFVHVGPDALAVNQELNAAAHMLLHHDQFLAHPVASILDPQNVSAVRDKELTFFEEKFAKAGDKGKLVSQISDHLKGIVRSQSLIHEILGVADELITNAIFNAPFVDRTNNSSGIGRKESDVKMSNGKEGRLFLGQDGQRLVIGAHDPYGTLNLLRLFQRILDCYTSGVAQNINMGQGGAGIGSFMVFNACSSYFAAVKGGHLTVVCCILPLTLSGRKRAVLPKNIHYFHQEEGE